MPQPTIDPGAAMMTAGRLAHELDTAEQKAIDSLARYKFQMFGYWAGIWVHLNRIEGRNRPNPFGALVTQARAIRDADPRQSTLTIEE